MVAQHRPEQEERDHRHAEGGRTEVRAAGRHVLGSDYAELRRRLVKMLALKSDVILENFKPGSEWRRSILCIDANHRRRAALEKWNLGPADLHPLNPSLIFTRVSGYGQTGPWASRPGYASVCEAESGFRYITGQPDPETGALSGPPVRPNISLGDSVAGLHAAFGTVRSRAPHAPLGLLTASGFPGARPHVPQESRNAGAARWPDGRCEHLREASRATRLRGRAARLILPINLQHDQPHGGNHP